MYFSVSRRNDTNRSLVGEKRVGEKRVGEKRVGEMRVGRNEPFNPINILSLQSLISLSYFYLDCPDDKFQCDNGQCIHIVEVCNGQILCSDGSDEDDCSDFG